MALPTSAVSSSMPSIPPNAYIPGLLEVPSDVLKLILKLLDPFSFNMAQRSCKALRSICRSMKVRLVPFRSNKDFCLEAAKQGHLGILKFFFERQPRQNKTEKIWDKSTCAVAARGGHLEVIQWLRVKGCPWNAMTCAFAAQNGHLQVLQWARQNGCPWDKWTCAFAAQNGHLQVLQWARQNGCPWDKWTCAFAAQNGHLHVLQWARQNSCPWNKNECLSEAKRQDHSHIVKWIEENDKAIAS